MKRRLINVLKKLNKKKKNFKVREKLRTICKEKDFETLCNFLVSKCNENLESHMMSVLKNCNQK